LRLLDLKRDVALAKTQIPVPDDYAALHPVQCAIDGDNVYLLANVDTQAPRSLTLLLKVVTATAMPWA